LWLKTGGGFGQRIFVEIFVFLVYYIIIGIMLKKNKIQEGDRIENVGKNKES